jgi:GNAT superfamily N-acetyltransferase
MFGTLVHKFKRNLSDYGFLIAVKKMLLYPFSDVYKKKDYLIYKKDLNAYEPKDKTNLSFEYRFLDGTNLDDKILHQILSMEEWLIDKMKDVLKHGGLCVVAMDGEKVAGFNLVSFNLVNIPLIEMDKRFRGNQAWSEQITVSKDYRSQGLGSILRFKMFNELKRRGYKSLYGGTMWDNWSNIELSKKVGFEIFVKVKFKRLFKRKKYFYERIYSNQM